MTTYETSYGEVEEVQGVLFTDLEGQQHDVYGALWNTGERVVYYDLDAYAPAEMRRMAAHMMAEADRIENSIFVIAGGAS